jgi:hypothetical protein
MWHDSLSEFAARFGIPERLAPRFQCTAEHLTARQDGGTHRATNIAAACRHCNLQRHRQKVPMAAEAFRAHVQKRVAQGKWPKGSK